MKRQLIYDVREVILNILIYNTDRDVIKMFSIIQFVPALMKLEPNVQKRRQIAF